MAEVDKVSVGFDADIRDFNRGIDRMERKVQEFERKTDTEVAKVNKRFDLMGGTLDKVEKKMGGFGDNVDLKNVRDNLEKAQDEFRETGKVSEEALNGLNKSIENVDFTKLDRGATRSMKIIQQDTEKLSTSLGKLEHFHLAKELPNEAKLLGNEFSKLETAINNDKLALDQLKSKMKPKDFNDYRNSIDNVSKTMTTFKSELKDTGRVSNDTFYKLKNDINSVNFNRLPGASQKAVAKVKNHVIDLGVEFDKMGTHVTRNEARMDRLRVKISNGMTTINDRFQEGMRVFNVWGNRFRNIAEVGEHMFGGVLVPAITALGPALATGTTGLMGLTNGLTSVGGAAAGMAGAFGMSLVAVKAFTGQATYALQMLEDGTLQATNETRRYQSSLEALKNEWEGLIAQNQARIFNTMTNGINAARYALGQLNPFLTSTAGQIESLSSRVLNWVRTSKNAQNAFKVLNTVGVEAFGSMLRAAFSFLDGVTAVFVKLSPLYSWAAKGFENMAKSFREWANSAAATKEINAFIEFTKTNVPIVLNIFKNTFAGIFYLFKAFAGQTSWAMKGLEGMTEAFKNWAKELPKTEGFKAFLKFSRDNAPVVADLIKNLFNVIVELVKIMAPITVFTAKIASAVLGMAASFMKAHPAISRVIASFVIFFGLIKSAVFITSLISSFVQLRKVLTLLFGTQKAGILINKLFNKEVAKQKGAVGLAKSAITGLIGKIKELATSQMVTTAKTKIATAAQKAWQGVVNAGKATADAYRYAMARLATSKTIAAAKTKIATAATMAWTGVTKAASLAAKGLGAAFRFMTGPVGIIITVIGTLIGVFVHLYKTNEDFRNFVNRCWNAIKNTAISVFGYLKNFFVNIWNGIKNISISTWNYLATALPNLWRNTVNGAKNIFRNLGAFFTNLWNGIKNVTVMAWNGIKTAMSTSARLSVNVLKSVFRGLGAFFTGLWNGVRMVFVRSWQFIKTTTSNLARGTVNVLKAVFRGLGAFFTNLWNGIKNISIRSWNAIKNGVLAIARIYIASLKAIFRGLSAFFSMIWNGIKRVSIAAWNGIKNSVIAIARLMVAGIRSVINGTKAVVSAAWNFIKRISVATWNFIKNSVIRSMRAMLTGVRVIITALRSFIVKAWTYIKTKVVLLARSLYIGVRSVFTTLYNFTRRIFNNIKNFIVKTWNFIKSRVVSVVRSMVKIIQSIFRGLSNYTRKIFNSIKNFLVKTWNYIKSKIVSVVRSMVKIVQGIFRGFSNYTRKIFNSIKNFLVKTWNYIKNKVTSIVRALYKALRSIFNTLSRITRSIFNNLKNFLIKLWTVIKNKVVSLARNMWNSVRRIFDTFSRVSRSIFSKLKNSITGTWRSLKNTMINFTRDMWNGVRRVFSNMTNGIKNFVGRIKSHLDDMVRGVKNGLNTLIEGVNWVGDKLGMGKQMIKPIKLSTGTGKASSYISNGKINRDTMAVVGDKGRGNGAGGFRHETITYPNGKQVITPDTDTLAYLPKGSTVHSGAQTQTAFSEGTLPKFSIGTAISNTLGGGKKPKKHKKDDNVVGDVMQKTKDGIKGMTGTVVEGGKAVVDGALNAAKKGKDWLSDEIGDVLDWIEKPKKLLDKVFEGFGLSMSSFGIPENAQIPFKLMTGMFKKLKEAAVNKVKEWFEESMAGDGGYIDLSKGINFGFAPTAAAAAAQGYPFARPHFGLDINYKHDKVYSTMSGTARTFNGWSGGFGRHVEVTNGTLKSIYGHLHKLAFSGTKKVRPGTLLGISGGDPREDGQNAGSSTGLHLHYEMQRNGRAFDPTSWLKKNNGGGGSKGGVSKAASAWRGEIVRAAKKMKVHPTNAQINGIIAQIQRESGGDSGIVQGNIGDINNLRGTPARGLLQYVPSTFASYAVAGHKNINSGYDQLLAFFNNSNWANDIQYGRSGWGPRGHRRYERGGIVNFEQLAWIAEGGFSESIISHDPKYRARSKAIHDRTGEMLGFNEDTEILRNLERLLMLQNKHAQAIEGHTKRTAEKDTDIYMDGRKVGKQIAPHVDTEIKQNKQRKARFN